MGIHCNDIMLGRICNYVEGMKKETCIGISSKIMQSIDQYKNFPFIVTHILCYYFRITKSVSHIIAEYTEPVHAYFLFNLLDLINPLRRSEGFTYADYDTLIIILVRHYNLFTQKIELPRFDSDEMIGEIYSQKLDKNYMRAMMINVSQIKLLRAFFESYRKDILKLNYFFESHETFLLSIKERERCLCDCNYYNIISGIRSNFMLHNKHCIKINKYDPESQNFPNQQKKYSIKENNR